MAETMFFKATEAPMTRYPKPIEATRNFLKTKKSVPADSTLERIETQA
jgi:hypothetical protein